MQKENSTKKNTDKYPVIALAGSAGALQAFDDFFSEMPSGLDFVYVVIMHLVPKNRLNVTTLIQKFTAMPVIEVTDGLRMKPNCVYVIPPLKNMAIQSNKFLLFPISIQNSVSQCIDFFLRSLAEAKWNKAITVICSGIGNDGQLGVRLIAEKLGFVIAQSPESAQYPGMPEAAIETDCVNLILHPKDMPKELIKYINHPLIIDQNSHTVKEEEHHHIVLQKILLLLRSQTGHDFTMYKTNTINRRIERRMAENKLLNLEAYLSFITDNPVEMNILFKEMLIGVTRFFRDREAFEAIAKLLYAKMNEKNEQQVTRIWIAGCSTGEESYSIAMMVLEYLDKVKLGKKGKVQIFATDLDDAAIDKARIGWYDNRIVEDVSDQRLNRFFVEKNKGFLVKKELREMIVFAKHSLINDAPFTKLDLLCCRNVMIYFSATLQKRLFPVFHYSLNNNGLLFLGPAETIGTFDEAFTIINPKWKIFERRDATNNLVKMIDFPFNIVIPNLKKNESIDKPKTKIPMVNSFHKILIDRYTPASLLVNEKGDILYINGDVNGYLSLEAGEAMMNIHKVVKNELRHAIGNAIHQAGQQKKNIPPMEVKLAIDKKFHLVSFAVDYLTDTNLKGMFIITFKDLGETKRTKKLSSIDENGQGLAVKELESELNFTKLQLNSTIEQMESSLEELKSTNEELQSTNEELQSTNEEALTTKEEMQSLNEELMTINLQHQAKTDELTRLNNDMKNLLDNTEIGTIFLDNHLKILRFTPQVTKLFNVIPQDVGRSITHIVSNFDYPEIEDTIISVIDRLTGREIEVKTKKNEWYNLRIMPYRTIDNFISGAVLTFTKITPLKSLEDKLESLMNYAHSSLETYSHAAIMLSSEHKILVANKLFLDLFKMKFEEIREQSFMEIVINKWKAVRLTELLTDAKNASAFYLEHNFPGVGLKKMTVELYRNDLENQEAQVPLTLFFKESSPYERQE